MLTRQDVNELSLIRNKTDNQRDVLDGALNRMHLAKSYEELENWYDWSKIHLRELDKLLHQKVQFLVEHSKQEEAEVKNNNGWTRTSCKTNLPRR